MKYYTKEWYQLMQRQDYTMNAKKIPDNDYNESEIEEFITEAEIEYCKENELDLDEDSRNEFRDVLNDNIALQDMSNLPDWVFDEVDPRLIALELYPESVYNRLKDEEIRNKERFEKISNDAKEEEKSHPELDEVRMLLACHDETILKIFEQGDQVELTVTDDSTEGNNSFKKIIFSGNARISSDDNEIIDSLRGKVSYDDKITWLYEEIANENGTYSIDILTCNDFSELYYIKIECKAIALANT